MAVSLSPLDGSNDVAARSDLIAVQDNVGEVVCWAASGRRAGGGDRALSSWAAILFAPRLVGTIYGMNFAHMPELGWRFGYSFAVLLMAVVCTGLYVIFKRKDWL
jgi:magnesium transporter